MRRPPARGMTLIEVMVTIGIVAILASLAVPSFVDTIARQRLTGALSSFTADLQYTRSEAIRRSNLTRLTIAGDGASYTVEYSDGALNAPHWITVKTVEMPDTVSLTSGLVIAFEGVRGFTKASHDVEIKSTRTSVTLKAQTDYAGRVSACSPGGSFPGYESC